MPEDTIPAGSNATLSKSLRDAENVRIAREGGRSQPISVPQRHRQGSESCSEASASSSSPKKNVFDRMMNSLRRKKTDSTASSDSSFAAVSVASNASSDAYITTEPIYDTPSDSCPSPGSSPEPTRVAFGSPSASKPGSRVDKATAADANDYSYIDSKKTKALQRALGTQNSDRRPNENTVGYVAMSRAQSDVNEEEDVYMDITPRAKQGSHMNGAIAQQSPGTSRRYRNDRHGGTVSRGLAAHATPPSL